MFYHDYDGDNEEYCDDDNDDDHEDQESAAGDKSSKWIYSNESLDSGEIIIKNEEEGEGDEEGDYLLFPKTNNNESNENTVDGESNGPIMNTEV